MPDEPEVFGLLALMLLHDSRRAARVRDGELVLLADQDRALWDRAQIRAGREALERARALRGEGAAMCCRRRSPRCTLRTQRLAADRRALRAAARADRLARRGAQPRRRDGRSGRRRGGPASDRALGVSTATTTCTPPAASCCAGSGDATTRRATAYERALELVRSEPERRFLQRRLRGAVAL